MCNFQLKNSNKFKKINFKKLKFYLKKNIVIDRRTYYLFPASSLGTMHAYSSANSFPPLRTRTLHILRCLWYWSFESYEWFRFEFCFVTNDEQEIIIVEDLDWFMAEKSMAVSLFVNVHIHFSLFNFLAFKTLVNGYIWLKDHKLFSQVMDIFPSEASLSSVEISKLMIVNWNSLRRAIKSVIMALQTDDD